MLCALLLLHLTVSGVQSHVSQCKFRGQWGPLYKMLCQHTWRCWCSVGSETTHEPLGLCCTKCAKLLYSNNYTVGCMSRCTYINSKASHRHNLDHDFTQSDSRRVIPDFHQCNGALHVISYSANEGKRMYLDLCGEIVK